MSKLISILAIQLFGLCIILTPTIIFADESCNVSGGGQQGTVTITTKLLNPVIPPNYEITFELDPNALDILRDHNIGLETGGGFGGSSVYTNPISVTTSNIAFVIRAGNINPDNNDSLSKFTDPGKHQISIYEAAGGSSGSTGRSNICLASAVFDYEITNPRVLECSGQITDSSTSQGINGVVIEVYDGAAASPTRTYNVTSDDGKYAFRPSSGGFGPGSQQTHKVIFKNNDYQDYIVDYLLPVTPQACPGNISLKSVALKGYVCDKGTCRESNPGESSKYLDNNMCSKDCGLYIYDTGRLYCRPALPNETTGIIYSKSECEAKTPLAGTDNCVYNKTVNKCVCNPNSVSGGQPLTECLKKVTSSIYSGIDCSKPENKDKCSTSAGQTCNINTNEVIKIENITAKKEDMPNTRTNPISTCSDGTDLREVDKRTDNPNSCNPEASCYKAVTGTGGFAAYFCYREQKTVAAKTTYSDKNGNPIDMDSKNLGVYTAIGCIPTEPSALITKLLTFAAGGAGGIALLLMIFGAFRMTTSAGNPESLKAGQEQFSSAVIGLLFIIFAVLLLQIIGVDILGLPGFTK
ncbi:hypothetical protein HYW46_06740 [Candidatus Daviesbacteria bacterium]|nr:hypothetical protein [Candidatus Daviesbacteria bacterium]